MEVKEQLPCLEGQCRTANMAAVDTHHSGSTDILVWCPAGAGSAAPSALIRCSQLLWDHDQEHIQLFFLGQMYLLCVQVNMFSGSDAMDDTFWQFPICFVGYCLFFQIPICLCFHPFHALIFILSWYPAYISWFQPTLDTMTIVFHRCHYQLPQASKFYKSLIPYQP